jgi:alpha-ketoglutarate-dependent 2,4-dichlorophenoxyacetate dioxygenase
MPMPITIFPITPGFAAEIGDIDLSRPLTPGEVVTIKQAFWDFAVLVFPEQKLSEQQHLEFASHIGPLETSIAALNKDAKLRIRAELADVSNLNLRNEIWKEDSRLRALAHANRLWHTDSSFKYLPARASILYARKIPPIGGHTEFADLRAAYDALPADLARMLPGLVADHALAHSRARTGFTSFTEEERRSLPPVPQVIVRTIPENGRKSLYLASHAGRIRGMSEAESLALIDRLIAHATQRQFVYTHRWRLHDLVMWDDRCTMHRGTDYDDLRWSRDMQRATVSDIANTCEQEGVAVAAA